MLAMVALRVRQAVVPKVTLKVNNTGKLKEPF